MRHRTTSSTRNLLPSSKRREALALCAVGGQPHRSHSATTQPRKASKTSSNCRERRPHLGGHECAGHAWGVVGNTNLSGVVHGDDAPIPLTLSDQLLQSIPCGFLRIAAVAVHQVYDR